MRYAPEKLSVKAGQTVRFVVTNAGQIRHEFVIGDAEEQRKHAEMMKEMPGMKHDEGNALTLEPGETRELVWQFGKAGKSGDCVSCAWALRSRHARHSDGGDMNRAISRFSMGIVKDSSD